MQPYSSTFVSVISSRFVANRATVQAILRERELLEIRGALRHCVSSCSVLIQWNVHVVLDLRLDILSVSLLTSSRRSAHHLAPALLVDELHLRNLDHAPPRPPLRVNLHDNTPAGMPGELVAELDDLGRCLHHRARTSCSATVTTNTSEARGEEGGNDVAANLVLVVAAPEQLQPTEGQGCIVRGRILCSFCKGNRPGFTWRP